MVSSNEEYIDLIGEFAETVDHQALGRIAKGTLSRERFYFDRWYNYFIFELPAGSVRNCYVNISLPPTIGKYVIDYIDLDIDLIIWPDGRTETLDLDEFETNSIRYAYPAEIREGALKTLNKITDGSYTIPRRISLPEL